jgi:hypothetical protein
MHEKAPNINNLSLASESSGFAQNTEREPQYKEIAGMRFDSKLGDNLIQNLVQEYAMSDGARDARERTEERSFFEHAMAGGSVDVDNHPLTPYALLNSKATVQEIILKRERSGKYNSARVIGGLDLRSIGLSASETGRIVLEVTPDIGQEFMAIVKQAREISIQKRPDLKGHIGCEFGAVTLHDETGQIVMPILTGLSNVQLPANFQNKIHLKELIYKHKSDVVEVIDQNGWRFDHPDLHP